MQLSLGSSFNRNRIRQSRVFLRLLLSRTLIIKELASRVLECLRRQQARTHRLGL
jgi:hypothetical protein